MIKNTKYTKVNKNLPLIKLKTISNGLEINPNILEKLMDGNMLLLLLLLVVAVDDNADNASEFLSEFNGFWVRGTTLII